MGNALVTGQAEAEDNMRGKTVVYSVVRVCVCACMNTYICVKS